jgi:hypothetical protein
VLKPDWHGVRAAGHVERHTAILRELTHEISPDPDRPDRPANATEAEARLLAYVDRLQASAPRTGLGAATGDFVDHLAKLARRYASHLFVCFDDARIPATTNGLEHYFGEVKRFLRQAIGAASTAMGTAQNLGPEILMTYAGAGDLRAKVETLKFTAEEYESARARIDAAERPIRQRRSYVRHLEGNLERLLDRWAAQFSPCD